LKQGGLEFGRGKEGSESSNSLCEELSQGMLNIGVESRQPVVDLWQLDKRDFPLEVDSFALF
jgi:hypothetical protein